MKYILAIFLTLILISCKQKSNNNFEHKIIGEWKYVKEIQKLDKNGVVPPPPPFGSQEVGYEFNDNGTFDYKLGFFKYISGDENQRSQNVFKGFTSNYKIENDYLKLYDLSSEEWEIYKIASIEFDTLKILNSDGEIDKFHKTNYTIDYSKTFDKIIMSSTGCFGSCPVTDIEIDKSGKVLFKGGYSSSIKGNYKSKISKEMFSKINLSFLKSNWTNLENEYISRWSDDETVYVTFVKNGKIIKTIKDYGRKAPTEFSWAYTPIRYLQENIKLEKIVKDTTLFDFNYFYFSKKDSVCSLTKSESFYLKNLLSESNIVEKIFDEKYIMEYQSNEKEKKLFTDGRYFKIEKSKGKFIIFDLKYDFIKQNNLMKRFRKENENHN